MAAEVGVRGELFLGHVTAISLYYVFDCKQGSVAGLGGGCVCVDPLRGLKEPETRKPLNAGWVAARLCGVERRG